MQLLLAAKDQGPSPRCRPPPPLVTVSAAKDPPCNPLTTEQISKPPVYPRAIRIAISFASEHVTAKFITFKSFGRVLTISSANSTVQELLYQEDW